MAFSLRNLFNLSKQTTQRGINYLTQKFIPVIRRGAQTVYEAPKRGAQIIAEQFKRPIQQQPTATKIEGLKNILTQISKPRPEIPKYLSEIAKKAYTKTQELPKPLSTIARGSKTTADVLSSLISSQTPTSEEFKAGMTPPKYLAKKGLTPEQQKIGQEKMLWTVFGMTEPLAGVGKKITKPTIEAGKGIVNKISKRIMPLSEEVALKSARLGRGEYKAGEVYYQDLGRLGRRGVLVSGKDEAGNVLGWYLPDPQSAKILGEKGAFLPEAKFTRPQKELSIPKDVTDSQLKQVINKVFYPKKISGKLEPLVKEARKYKIIEAGGKTRTVNGEPVKIIEGIDTFLRKGDGGWVVSEASTGRYISDSVSKEGAITKAKFNINQLGKDKTIQTIKKYQLKSIPTEKIKPASVEEILIDQRDITAKKLNEILPKLHKNVGDIKIKPDEIPMDTWIEAKDIMQKIEKGTDTANDLKKANELIKLSEYVETKPTKELPSLIQKAVPEGRGIERGFIKTVKESPKTNEAVKKAIYGTYEPRATSDLQIKAKNFVDENIQAATDFARAGRGDKSVAVAIELINKHQSLGNYDAAIDLVNEFAPRLTEAGRTIQAISLYNRLSPEGILRFTQRELNNAMRANPKLRLNISPAKAEKLVAQAKKIQPMEEGYAKLLETKKLLKEVYNEIPKSWTEKASTLQTMAQLINPKTWIRNIVGNLGFAGTENISQTLATPLDYLLSKITKQRTTTFPSLIEQLKGAKKGAIRGMEEVKAGVETLGGTQFELPQVPVFRNKILAGLEKTMNYELRVPDKMAFQSAFDDTLRGLMKLNKTNQATPEMLEIATHAGLYRTFQDKNAISNFFVSTKKLLNKIGGFTVNGKSFGLGDLILKYPKTPGNLLARGIEYSPLGFIQTIFEASKPLMGKPFNQRAFVNSFSRAITGTVGLVGTGIILAKLGIITEAPSKDPDVRAIQKISGQGAYQINVSALKRFILSGLNAKTTNLKKNDILISYDWFQPAAISVSMGAKIANKGGLGNIGKTGLESLTGGIETISEQPMVRGLQQFASGQRKPLEALADTLKGAPASMIPTLLSQLRQVTDNTARQTYSPDVLQETINLAKYKIPSISKTLPEKIDVFGKPQEVYQKKSNTLFNVFFNPAFITKYNPSTEAEEVLRIMKETGETKQMPKVVSKSVMVNGESMQLSPKQINEMQKYIGSKTKIIIKQLLSDPQYTKLSDEERAKKISNLLSYIGTAAKIELLGHKPSQKDTSVEAILRGKYKLTKTQERKSTTFWNKYSTIKR